MLVEFELNLNSAAIKYTKCSAPDPNDKNASNLYNYQKHMQNIAIVLPTILHTAIIHCTDYLTHTRVVHTAIIHCTDYLTHTRVVHTAIIHCTDYLTHTRVVHTAIIHCTDYLTHTRVVLRVSITIILPTLVCQVENHTLHSTVS